MAEAPQAPVAELGYAMVSNTIAERHVGSNPTGGTSGAQNCRAPMIEAITGRLRLVTGHMNAHEFRRHGHAVIDWIADYYERVDSFPVLSSVSPGEVRASLPAHPPEY